MTRRLHRAVAVVVVALAVGGACGRGGARLGAGEDVDVCGWTEIDAFDEPALDEPGDVEEWATGVLRVIDRIDLDEEVDDEPVPGAVGRRLAEVERTVRTYRDAVDDASGDAAAVRRATADFARSGYGRASTAVTDWVGENCTEDDA